MLTLAKVVASEITLGFAVMFLGTRVIAIVIALSRLIVLFIKRAYATEFDQGEGRFSLCGHRGRPVIGDTAGST